MYDYSIIYKADRWICDITLGLILTCLGRIYVSDENMTSYRRFQKKEEQIFVLVYWVKMAQSKD
jgi:hypothetical protein